jgi:hypothetical protein
MNPKLKRPKLKAALKRFQKLPSLPPETDPQQPPEESAGEQPTRPHVLVMSASPGNTMVLQTMAE